MIDPAASIACPVCWSDSTDARTAGNRIDRLASAISHARVVRVAQRQGAFTALSGSWESAHLDYRKCTQCGAVCDADLHALTASDAAAKISTLRRLLARETSRLPRARHV